MLPGPDWYISQQFRIEGWKVLGQVLPAWVYFILGPTLGGGRSGAPVTPDHGAETKAEFEKTSKGAEPGPVPGQPHPHPRLRGFSDRERTRCPE